MNIKYNLYNKRLVIYITIIMLFKRCLLNLNILLYFRNNLYSYVGVKKEFWIYIDNIFNKLTM